MGAQLRSCVEFVRGVRAQLSVTKFEDVQRLGVGGWSEGVGLGSWV